MRLPLLAECPVRLTAPRPIGEVISTAGGVDFAALDEAFMVRSHAGLFVCGEMLDWVLVLDDASKGYPAPGTMRK